MKIIRITNQEELSLAFEVRRKVFIEEQGIPEADEYDQYDKLDDGTVHILLFAEGNPAGTGRLRLVDDYGKLERICLLSTYRKKGYGQELIKELEKIVKEKRKSKLILHGQAQAAGFYKKLGYEISSDEFIEDGIPHFLMTKNSLNHRRV